MNRSEHIKRMRTQELQEDVKKKEEMLVNEGYTVEYGHIGNRTTYALLTKEGHEIVGYTYVVDLAYKNELVGKHRALQQALLRKEEESKKIKSGAAS